jgi:hypothetical protein
VPISFNSYWAINASAQQPEPFVDEWPAATYQQDRNSATQHGMLSDLRPVMLRVPQFPPRPKSYRLEVCRPAGRCIINLPLSFPDSTDLSTPWTSHRSPGRVSVELTANRYEEEILTGG